MKLYYATATVRLVVQAESELDALLRADEYAMGAARDAGLESDWADDIRSLYDSPAGWTGNNLPYGGDGTQSIRAILETAPPPVVRDTFTVDMFSALQ
jgi:hypothetical protein